MAHKVGQGSSRNGRTSQPKFRGVKCYGGEAVETGYIIVRQKGNKVFPGKHVGQGKDFTLFALTPGTVKFERKKKLVVHVVPAGAEATGSN